MRRIVKIAAIGICVGLFLVIIKEGFQIDGAAFWLLIGSSPRSS